MTDSVPAPMVPAADILALADEWQAKSDAASMPRAIGLSEAADALRALLDAADTPRDEQHDCDSGGEDGYCSNCDPALASTIPAAPPDPVEDARCMASLIVKGEWFGCENGVGHSGCHGSTGAETVWGCGEPQTAPVPVSDEAPPPEPYNVCKCGHREAWHSTPYSETCTGEFGRCECATYEFDHAWPPPPVSAEEAWDEWRELTRKNLSPPDKWPLERAAFLAGWAAREDA